MKNSKLQSRLKRKQRIRKKIFGESERPRLAVYRSIKHIGAQIIDDTQSKTLVSISTQMKDFSSLGGNIQGAEKAGEKLAELALGKGIQKVVFDRGGYLYHGRVKAFAEAARAKGLIF